MDVLHVGTDGYAVQTRHLGGKQAALQAPVGDCDLGLAAGHLPVGLRGQTPEVGIPDQLPGGVSAGGLQCGSELLGDAFDPVHQHPLAGIEAAPHQGLDADALVQRREDPQAQGGLGDLLLAGYILDQAIGKGHQEADHVQAVLAGEGLFSLPLPVFRYRQADFDPGVCHAVFPFDLRAKPFHSSLYILFFSFPLKKKVGLGIAGDGIVPLSAAHADNIEFSDLRELIEEPGQEQDGVGPALPDLIARMSAEQASDLDRDRDPFLQLFSAGQGADLLGPAGAAGGNDALVLGIEIDHPAAVERGQVQSLRPQKAHFLVDGKNALQRRALERFISQKGQHHGDCNPVVGPQGRPVGRQPFSVRQQGDGLGLQVNVLRGLLGQDHVDMALQGHRVPVLETGRSLPADDQVAHVVPVIVKPVLFCELLQVVTDLFRVEGPVGNGCDLSEVGEYIERLQVLHPFPGPDRLFFDRFLCNRRVCRSFLCCSLFGNGFTCHSFFCSRFFCDIFFSNVFF